MIVIDYYLSYYVSVVCIIDVSGFGISGFGISGFGSLSAFINSSLDLFS